MGPRDLLLCRESRIRWELKKRERAGGGQADKGKKSPLRDRAAETDRDEEKSIKA